MKFWSTLLGFLMVSFLWSQDNHHWFQTYGAHNGALGGNVVAGVRDNSALYYNPGAIGFNPLANVSIGGTVYGFN
jgi:hypothetical protein